MNDLISEAQLIKLHKFTESDLKNLGEPDVVSKMPDGSAIKKWLKERVETFKNVPMVSLSQLKSDYGFSDS